MWIETLERKVTEEGFTNGALQHLFDIRCYCEEQKDNKKESCFKD